MATSLPMAAAGRVKAASVQEGDSIATPLALFGGKEEELEQEEEEEGEALEGGEEEEE